MDAIEQWVRDYTWLAWLVVAGILVGVEMLSLDLVLAMLGIGAAAGAISSLLGAPFYVDVIVFVAVSVAMLAVVRPSVVKRLHGAPTLVTGHDALVGRAAQTLTAVDETSGQVRLAGETWSARTFDPSVVIEQGARVEVREIDGATAVVHPVD